MLSPTATNVSLLDAHRQKLATSIVLRARQVLEDGPSMVDADLPTMYKIWVSDVGHENL